MVVEIIIPTVDINALKEICVAFCEGIIMIIGVYQIRIGYTRREIPTIISGLIIIIFGLTMACVHYGLLVIKFQ